MAAARRATLRAALADGPTGHTPEPETSDSAGTPSGERAPIGPHPSDGNRDVLGRFAPENTSRLVHGGRSKQRSALLAPVRAAERAAVLEGLALDEATVTH